MDAHFADFLHSAGTIIAIIGFMWQINKSQMEKIDKRFDRLEERMARIEQNHLDHITTLHAVPSTPPVNTEETG